jgi:predicted branched-subunit amino acid permease
MLQLLETKNQHKRHGKLVPAMLGLALGLAWWSYDFGLVYLGVTILAMLMKKKIARGSIFVLIVSFLIGASPLIYDNLTSNFANLKHLLYGRAINEPFVEHFVRSAAGFFNMILPHFLQEMDKLNSR